MPERVIRTVDQLRALCAQLEPELRDGRAVRMIFYRHRDIRSPAQNNTYHWQQTHLAMHIAQADTGFSWQQIKSIMHDDLKRKYCPDKRLVLLDQTLEVQTTTLLDTLEMSDFSEQCAADAAERFGYVLPVPIPRNVREEIPEEGEG
jgi:hypothetical protein